MAPAARRAVLCVPFEDRRDLADALRRELLDGPNADKEVWYDAEMIRCADSGNPRVYTGTPLSPGAYVAVHRPLTGEELGRLKKEQHRPCGQGSPSAMSARGLAAARPAEHGAPASGARHAGSGKYPAATRPAPASAAVSPVSRYVTDAAGPA